MARAYAPQTQIVWKISTDMLSGVKGFLCYVKIHLFVLLVKRAQKFSAVGGIIRQALRELDWQVLSSILHHPCWAKHQPYLSSSISPGVFPGLAAISGAHLQSSLGYKELPSRAWHLSAHVTYIMWSSDKQVCLLSLNASYMWNNNKTRTWQDVI